MESWRCTARPWKWDLVKMDIQAAANYIFGEGQDDNANP